MSTTSSHRPDTAPRVRSRTHASGGTSSRSHRRANRVGEDLAVAVALIAGALAMFSPAQPTGRPIVDALLVGTSVALVVYASASAPWWAVAVVAGVAMSIGLHPLLILLGIVAGGVGLWIGMRRRSAPVLRALSVGISMNAIAWSALGVGFFGLSALIGISVGVFILLAGTRRRPRRVRRIVWWGVGTTATLAVVALAGFGLAAAGARDDLEAGQQQAESGITALQDGDFELAAEQFAAAGASLRDAEDRLSSPWALGAAVVPVVSQHRAVALDMAGAGADATTQVAFALDQVDPSALRVNSGTIDVDALAALATPFADVDAALQRFAVTLDAPQSAWLVAPIIDKLDSLSERIAESAPRIDKARRAIAVAPNMLGASGPRNYLILFTTPAEARGLGGFVGNYAQLTVDQGRFSMSEFGRVSDLEARAVEIGARLDGPAEFLETYGQFGYNKDGNGLVDSAAFRNLTMSPNFPWVGEVAANIYGQITGVTPDGVIAMDPCTIAALLGYTDGIELTSVSQSLTADNAAEYLLRGQYETATDNGERIDALEEAARKTVDALLTGSLPDPSAVADDFSDLRAERRLLIWTADATERDLVRDVGLLGEIPASDGADGWSVALTNGGGNKIDSFLQRRAGYESTTDPATGITTGRLRVELTNNAPASGLPDYVIGNAVGLPNGTSRLIVKFYSPLALDAMNVNGKPVMISASREVGWNVFTTTVDIPPGATTSFDLDFSGHLERPDTLVTWTQPLATPLKALN